LLNRLNYLAWAGTYWTKTKLFRQKIPFIGGLVLNESCNLACRHCRVANRKIIEDHSFEEAVTGLKTFYGMGIRSVFIEGGEPFLWKDRSATLETVINTARKIGFRTVSVYTNGTLPLKTNADTIFVSIDGLRESNDKLRGPVYDRIMKNISESEHPNIIINYTINAQNSCDIEKFCITIDNIPKIKGVFFYFHTPYYGTDELFIPLQGKKEIIEKILDLQKKGFRIFNSRSCLKSVAADTWKRPSDICYVYADRKLYQCCRAFGNEDICRNCGYLGYPEILHIMKLCPDSIIRALGYISK